VPGEIAQAAKRQNDNMTEINETIRKFGYPDTLLGDYDHWVVLLRPQQVTVGSLVLACKGAAASMAEVAAEAYAELQMVTGDLQSALKSSFDYDKINYLLLMMVDPQVHFHVIPRYGSTRELAGRAYADPFWPGPPDVRQALGLDEQSFIELYDELKRHWP